ncbi:hypothetical protein E2542_SST05672 [Spatholobus suberectus]|nr:hypothetical protein E2542_SST05672 [Spatholobus suberectus]
MAREKIMLYVSVRTIVFRQKENHLFFEELCYRITRRSSVTKETEDMRAKKVEVLDFMETDPIGWIAKAKRFIEKQEIHLSDWKSFSTTLIKRFKASYGSNIFSRLIKDWRGVESMLNLVVEMLEAMA